MLRRSEKLIGAYYRNALAKRLQALGYAIAPTLIGRMPGFEIPGYDRTLRDAFSDRRREILQLLEANGLPYSPVFAQMAALHTRRQKEDIGLAALIPHGSVGGGGSHSCAWLSVTSSVPAPRGLPCSGRGGLR